MRKAKTTTKIFTLLLSLLLLTTSLAACQNAPSEDKTNGIKQTEQQEATGEATEAAAEPSASEKEETTAEEKTTSDEEEAAAEPSASEKEEATAEEKTTAAEDESQEAPSEEVALSPLYGGKAIVGITQEPDFLDPHLAVAAGTKEILFNIFEGLVKLTPEGEFAPCLAENWQVEDEGRTLRFKLRPEVKFHNGEVVTAEDVKYSLERAAGLNGEDALLPELATIKEVEIDADGSEIVVRQAEADANLLAYLSCAIIPQDYDQQDKSPIGTGPFRFKSYQPQVSLELEKFPDYWQEGSPYLDGVVFKIYGDMDAAYMELLAGQIDIFPYMTEEKVQGLLDKYQLVAGGANMVQMLALNNAREPLDNLAVREAVNLAIGRAFLTEQIMGEYGQPIFSGMAPSMGRFYNEELKDVNLEAQPELAKEKLAEAGYSDGLKLKLTVPGNYLIHVDTANLLAAQLSQAGIEVEIETVDWGTWLERVYAGRDYQMTVIALTYDFYTPSNVLDRYCSEAANNFINFSNETYDELAQKAAKEQEQDKRIQDYRKMQEILWQDKASAFLQEPDNITALRKPLSGYVQYPAYVQDMSRVYFVDQAALDESLNK
ncbi:MAG: ABC transporter substrate-binding protein [Eubacteriales bacterium]|nr:ABC transporter substrate-binding protein [Eubacteriales bacterium]